MEEKLWASKAATIRIRSEMQKKSQNVLKTQTRDKIDVGSLGIVG